MSDHNELTIDYLRRELDAALARIAELEAQLAAQAWRPVTEPPLVEEAQCLLRSFTKRYGYEYKIASWVSVVENEWTGRREHRPGGYWYDGEGEYIDIDDWQEWQPLPAPPND